MSLLNQFFFVELKLVIMSTWHPCLFYQEIATWNNAVKSVQNPRFNLNLIHVDFYTLIIWWYQDGVWRNCLSFRSTWVHFDSWLGQCYLLQFSLLSIYEFCLFLKCFVFLFIMVFGDLWLLIKSWYLLSLFKLLHILFCFSSILY